LGAVRILAKGTEAVFVIGGGTILSSKFWKDRIHSLCNLAGKAIVEF